MENIPKIHHPYLLILCIPALLLLPPVIGAAADTISLTQPLTSSRTLVSSGGKFELGFFFPGNSGKLYVGVWYKELLPVKTIAWVLNRDNPLDNSTFPSALLQIGRDGNLILTANNSSYPLWSLNTTNSLPNSVAQLLDSGNLVLRPDDNADPSAYNWQGFDYPTDTLLPGMRLGWDSDSGLNRFLTSWKSPDDPSTGDFTFKLDINGSPEAFLRNKQQRRIYRSGPWNGQGFNGVPGMKPSVVINFTFVRNSTQVAYSFLLLNESLYSRLTVTPTGVLRRLAWIDNTGAWKLFWYAPADQCDNYVECGAYGICDTSTSPVCNCPKGFSPRNQQAWNLRDGSDGCDRRNELNCRDDGFLLLNNMKMPDTSATYVNDKMSLAECDAACRKNCSCTAYANTDIRGNGSGCAMWTGDLLDMRMYASAEGGQDLYLRVSASDVVQSNRTTTRTQKQAREEKETARIVGFSVGSGVALVGLLLMFLIWKKREARKAQRKDRIAESRERRSGPRERSQDMLISEGVMVSGDENATPEVLDLPLFDFGTITTATDNYSDANKLGQGGFGCVYKGMLVEGQAIAVKRLSKNSGQGIEEFKNEMRLIARLQHRNLVRLLGCCVHMEEKMLIYEFMENKSLDTILFNKERCSMLDWKSRFNIICGIARGLLYLHQDSRFRIIHRDLKASNILLDKEMNPKISDFGMARIFGTDQTEANTRRVVGTYGYMSPEYAMDGLFSVKSDVFSFGVLVLEIISGKKNRGFYTANQQLNLLGHAWRLWREGKGIELVDTISAGSSYSSLEVTRCVQVGLLCVQERAEDRPTMSNVVLMLSSESMSLAQPRHPGFCLGRHHAADTDTSSGMMDESGTINHVTVTILDGR